MYIQLDLQIQLGHDCVEIQRDTNRKYTVYYIQKMALAGGPEKERDIIGETLEERSKYCMTARACALGSVVTR